MTYHATLQWNIASTPSCGAPCLPDAYYTTVGTSTLDFTASGGQVSGTSSGQGEIRIDQWNCGGFVDFTSTGSVVGTVDASGSAALGFEVYVQSLTDAGGTAFDYTDPGDPSTYSCVPLALANITLPQGSGVLVASVSGRISEPGDSLAGTIESSGMGEGASGTVTLTINSVTGTSTSITTTQTTVSQNSSGSQGQSQPSATVACRPAFPLVGSRFDCLAIVTNLQYPVGGFGSIIDEGYSATWSPSAEANAFGATCGGYETYVSMELITTQDTCSATFTAQSAGPTVITFRFTPYMDNAPVQATTAVDIVSGSKAPSELALSCTPTLAGGAIDAPCKVTASGASGAPTGTVTWTASNGAGSLSSSTCALSVGSVVGSTTTGAGPGSSTSACTVQYHQDAVSAATITAKYQGDAIYEGGKASTSITPVVNDTASADLSQSTGLSVGINGTSGSVGTVTTVDYQAQPGGTGQQPFPSAEYFDVKVAGDLSGGEARVCYYGAEVNSTTSMDYYSGGWLPATGVNATSQVRVCGTIPASALSGTPVAIGASGPLAATATSATSTGTNSAQSGGAGIPGFPYEGLAVSLVAFLVVTSYLLVRRRSKPLSP